ncbi:neprosin family prolyl endopeptidase [Nocardia tengchongensis]|uniref:neprosin family prolyl endopeptidase n=1 Tax=Nocardia tengchongensis TaxID=2055889 RepID=UPI0036ACB1B7
MSPLHSSWRKPLQANAPSPTLAISPSGGLIAVGTSTGDGNGNSLGSLTVFDARTGTVVCTVSDDWQVYSLAFSPDDRWLAVAEARFHRPGIDQQRLRIVAAGTFAERCRFPAPLSTVPDRLAFGGDGSWVVCSMNEFGPPTRVFAFDAASGVERWRYHLRTVESLFLSRDSTVLAAAGSSGVVLLDPLTGTQRLRFPVPASTLRLACDPDNRRIAVGCGDGIVRVFDAVTGAAVWSASAVAGHTGSVVSIAISDDSQWVAAHSVIDQPDSAPNTGLLTVYDLEQGSPRFAPVEFGDFGTVAFSPALCDLFLTVPYGPRPEPHAFVSGFSVVDARTGALRARSSAGIQSLAVAPDGVSFTVGGEPFVETYDSGLLISSLTLGASPTALALSPAGTPLVAVADTGPAVTVFAASSGNMLARKPIPGTITAITFADRCTSVVAGGVAGVRLFSVVGDRSWKADTVGTVNALAAVGPGADWIATAAGRTVRLLSSAEGHERWAAPVTHPQAVTRIAASGDGAWIATGCTDRTTRILDSTTGTQTFGVTGDGKVRAIAFAPGRALLGTANEDGSLILIDAATATQRGRIDRPVGCARLAFGVDGTLLAAAWDDNTVSIYDISAPGPPPKLHEFICAAPISGLAVNPTDNTVAVTTADGTSISVRDPHSGIEPIRMLHPTTVRDIAISTDGVLVASSCDDTVVRVWRSGAAPPDHHNPEEQQEKTMDTGSIQRNPEAPLAPPQPRSGRDLEREAAERLDEIRQYFTDLYARRDVITQTTTSSGQQIDWIPAESQTVAALAEPPDSDLREPPRDRERHPYPEPFELADPRAEVGPPGTVPLQRKSVDLITATGTLDDYLAKGIRARRTTPPDDPGIVGPTAAVAVHKYAHAAQAVTNFGTEGFINTWKPYVQWSNEFSLGQLWVVRGNGTGLQTVEVGVQTYYDLYHDWNPHLFIFYTTNGYTQGGNNLGGYNTDVTGWVQSSNVAYPGMRIAESVQSGDQYEMSLKVTLFQSNWWVRVGNEWMGYYPAGLYNSGGLRDQADVIDWGGEIVDDQASHPEPTSTWMGSGHFPSEGWQHAAYMRNLAYQSDAAGTMTAMQGYPSVTNPNAYQISADFSGASTWGSYFYWGGPGGVA